MSFVPIFSFHSHWPPSCWVKRTDSNGVPFALPNGIEFEPIFFLSVFLSSAPSLVLPSLQFSLSWLLFLSFYLFFDLLFWAVVHWEHHFSLVVQRLHLILSSLKPLPLQGRERALPFFLQRTEVELALKLAHRLSRSITYPLSIWPFWVGKSDAICLGSQPGQESRQSEKGNEINSESHHRRRTLNTDPISTKKKKEKCWTETYRTSESS